MSTNPLSSEIFSAILTSNIPLLTTLLPSPLPPSTREAIASTAAEANQPLILSWCFDQGFTMPATSLNNEDYESACYAYFIPLFEFLLSHGLDLNVHSSEYCGDAHNPAASSGDVPFAKWLLEHGQDPNREVGGFGSMSTICKVVGGSHPPLPLLELLIKHGVRVVHTGAIVAAAKIGNVDAVEVLLDNGADIDERKCTFLNAEAEVESKGTALVTTCREGKEEVVELLLRRGADPDAVDDGGRSCLSVAIKGGYGETVKMLEEKEAKNRNGDVLKKRILILKSEERKLINEVV